MKTFLKKSTLFILLLLLASYAAYLLLNKYELSFYGQTMKTRWIMELKNKKVDYLFLGSSRMANTIAGHQFDSTLHVTSINIATPGSSYGESFLLFDQYLKNGNTAKTLILTLDLFKSKHKDKKAEALTPLVFKHFDFFPYFHQKNAHAVYEDHTELWRLYLWDYIPFSRYSEFNQYFKIQDGYNFLFRNERPEIVFDTITGEQLVYNYAFKGKNYAAPANIQLGPRGEKYLLAILKLAKENNIKIILLTAPYYKMEAYDRSYHNKYVEFLKNSYGVSYMDFTAPKEWKEFKYFSDPIHTNDIGSRLFTGMLADSLN